MDSISGTASEETSSRYQASCPYIGMVSDPQTHVGTPDSRNFCHLVNPPQEVSIGHQQGFCLGQHFSECPIYKSSGEDDSPDGVFEHGEKAGRGFGLFHFGRKSQGKPGKPEGNGPPPVVVPVAAAVIGAEAISEPVAKPVTPSEPKPVIQPEPKPTMDPVPVAQSEPIPDSSAALDSIESAVPVDEDEELRIRLYNEALSRYEQVNNSKKDRKGLWIILMIAAVFVLLVSVWGIYNRSQNLLRQSQVEAEMGYTRSLATAVQDMGAASDAWGTAASIIESRDMTGTAVLFGTATALQAGGVIEQTAQAATAIALAAAPSSQVGICQSIADAQIKVISGPTLLPAERTLYQPGLQTPQATWVIQNDGVCGWGQILLWSVTDNLITQPIVKRNGQLVILSR